MSIEEQLVSIINMPNTFIGDSPIEVDNCQWVKSSSGTPRVYFGKDNFDYPVFSIYVRGSNNKEVSQRAHNIFTSIRNWSDSISGLIARRCPYYIGRDDKYRSIYTFQLEFQTGGY